MNIKTVHDYDFSNKRVILRAELDVPMKNSEILSDSRLKANLETITFLLNAGAKNITIIGHLGRPKGIDSSKSLNLIKDRMESLLNQKILFVEDLNTDFSILENNKLLMLENLRFFAGEEDNDLEFCKNLAKFGDVFVNNCFSTMTRNHASFVGLPKLMPAFAGLKVIEELKELNISDKEKPITLILGGAKLETKLPVIKALLPQVNNILIGGAMVLVLLKTKNQYNGKILFDYKNYSELDSIKDDPKLILPVDFACTQEKDSENFEFKDVSEINENDYAYDLGPKSIEKFKEILLNSKTIIWNGPLGYYEKQAYLTSSNEIAKLISKLNTYTLIGGGDTEDVLKNLNISDKIDHVCIGGGSMLKYLSLSSLPGLEILKN